MILSVPAPTRRLPDAVVPRLVAAEQGAVRLIDDRPLRIIATDDRIELTDGYGGQHRSPYPLPGNRWQVISAGAVLFNLRLALRTLGRSTTIQPFPEASRPELVAVLTSRPGPPPTPEEQRLYDAIGALPDWSSPAGLGALPAGVSQQLSNHAAREGALLVPVDTPAQHDVLAELLIGALERRIVEPADAAPVLASHGLSEAAWAAAGHVPDDPRLGSPVGPGSPGGAVADPTGWQAVLRGMVHRDTLMVLATHADTEPDWLLAGYALQRVVLDATRFGLDASVISRPLESYRLRTDLVGLLDLAGHPHLLLRLS